MVCLVVGSVSLSLMDFVVKVERRKGPKRSAPWKKGPNVEDFCENHLSLYDSPEGAIMERTRIKR